MKLYGSNEPVVARGFGANLKAGFGATLLLAAWIIVTSISSGISGGADILTNNWYVRMGQWRADIRTLAACASYVVRGDSVSVP